MATSQLHRQWVPLGGWKTLVPVGCSAHTPSAQGCTHAGCQFFGWQFFLVQQGCGCRGLLRVLHALTRCPWPQQPHLHHAEGCPRSLMCLVCFTALGWSHHRPLGHLSPRTPSLLLLDQVGPWATVPCHQPP